MAFCVNCGAQNADEAKFCNGCGKTVTSAATPPQQKTVTVGQVFKCPSCGSPFESFQSRCSSCGYEKSTKEVSETISTFSTQIIQLDSQIAIEKEKMVAVKKSQAGWIILNIFTYGIPFVIRTLKRAIAPVLPPLTPTEQKKKSYIENFVIPNNREDILEFVLFAASKVESLLENKEDIGSVNRWAKIWSDKCKQAQSRAGIALSGDSQTTEQINRLLEKPQIMLAAAKKKEFIKAGVAIALLAALAILLVVAGATG